MPTRQIVATKTKNNGYFAPSSSLYHWRIFSQYWWVVLFIVGAYCAYSSRMNEKQKELNALKATLVTLNQKKQCEIEKNDELLSHLESRNDPEYIKLLLMKNLGLVSDDQTKVSFQ